jgi:hypothetical protein
MSCLKLTDKFVRAVTARDARQEYLDAIVPR